MIDLMSIARTEAEGGDLFGIFSGMFEPADINPTGYPDALSGRVATTMAR